MADPSSSYLICATPRSGSWMLCSILSQTGIAGRPAEFFGPSLTEEFMANDAIIGAADIEGYMDAIKRHATTANGVFGMKILALQTGVFLQRAAEHKKMAFASLKTAFE